LNRKQYRNDRLRVAVHTFVAVARDFRGQTKSADDRFGVKHRRARAASLLQHHESCADVDDPAGQPVSVVTDHALELEHVRLFSEDPAHPPKKKTT